MDNSKQCVEGREENPHDTKQKMVEKALQIYAAEMMLADRERHPA